MLKAVLQNGAIVPLEPLPPEWIEGTVIDIAIASSPAFDIDSWVEAMNQICEDSSTEDEAVERKAVEEHRARAKNQMRREMGFST